VGFTRYSLRMKRLTLALVLLVNTISFVPNSFAAASCASLNTPFVAEDGMTVTMNEITLVAKPGSTQITISYKLLNATPDKKIDEGSFKIFFDDGTSTPQYGSFGSLFPSDSLIRSHTWEYLKGISPTIISFNADFFANFVSVNNLNWSVPGKACDLTAAIKLAADKAAAEKAAIEKIASEKAAVEKAAVEKVAADKEKEAQAIVSLQIKNELNEIANVLMTNLDLLLTKSASSAVKSEIVSLQSLVKREISEFNFGILSRGPLVEMYKANLKNLNAKYLKVSASLKASTTITCIKGKSIKKVTGIKPVCPKGYKKK
jgi:hypothetical protein